MCFIGRGKDLRLCGCIHSVLPSVIKRCSVLFYGMFQFPKLVQQCIMVVSCSGSCSFFACRQCKNLCLKKF